MRRRHLNFQFSQMRVSERKGCLQTLPSGSILDKTLFCQFSIQSQTPPLLRSTPSNSEGDVHGRHHKVGKRTNPPTAQNRLCLPLPTSPVVGEVYLGEEWADSTGIKKDTREFVGPSSLFRVTKSLPEKKAGLPKGGECTDLLTTQNRQRLRLATTAVRQATGIYRSFRLRQRRCLPTALRALRTLRSLVALPQNRRPRPSGTPCLTSFVRQVF